METFHRIIGSDADTIVWWQMVCRGVLIFFYTLFLVRFGGRRIFGKTTSFDIVLGVILGSIMSRALTGNARFVPTLAAGTALVLLHWLLAELSHHSKTLGHLIKGTEVLLVEDGRIKQEALKKTNMTEHDLMVSLRSNGGTTDLQSVKAAYLERSGELSVITR
jgi:uncharacterized membrane protein YcaP (DUF421 family)